jgi:spore coat polysaccharide biosynthesis predicted glycosyltransferase SpsG
VIARVAGGPETGFGHLRRSWTLAGRLIQDGVAVQFVAATADGAGILAEAGFPVTVEAHPKGLDRTLDLLRQTPSPRLCFVDDPELSAARLAGLSACATVVCLDDTGEREMPVDLAVNGSAGAQTLAYRGLPQTQYLLGPDYILLRGEFAAVPARKPAPPEVRRVLILMGGGRAGTLPRHVAEVVTQVLPHAAVDIVAGPFGDDAPPAGMPGQVTWHRSPQDMRSLMLAADLAVSAGGQTLYELAATATPTLGIRVSPNHALNLKGLAGAGCLRDLGTPEEPDFRARLAGALADLAGDVKAREGMGRRGRNLVDGRGAERVAIRMQTLLSDAEIPREPRPCAI